MSEGNSEAAAGNSSAAARSETKPRRRTMEFKGLKLKLPKKLPFRILKYAKEEEVIEALEVILGPEQMEKVWDLDLDIDEGGELFEEVIAAMGLDAGKSGASQTS